MGNEMAKIHIFIVMTRDHNYYYQAHVDNSIPSLSFILWVGPVAWKIKVLWVTFFFLFDGNLVGHFSVNQRAVALEILF